MTPSLSMDRFTVALDERSYDILVGDDLLNDLPSYIPAKYKQSKCFVVTDTNVAPHYLETVTKALEAAGHSCASFVIPAGEASKSFSQLEDLLNQVFAHQPERSSLMVALGGGVIGDLTGFAASILLRGVPFIQVPTTLLAQVDSSVGGKTGINCQFGKNLIGSFYQPQLVLADMQTFKTLPPRELRAGFAEVVKYALINKPEFFTWLKDNVSDVAASDTAILREMVTICCRAKAEVVAADEKESGMRALLNLGHTFGHALEAEIGYGDTLLHGEAVAIGMCMAVRFSAEQGLCDEGVVPEIEAYLSQNGLPVHPTDIRKEWDASRLVGHMAQDKKVEKGNLVFILLRGIGQSYIEKQVPREKVEAFLEHYLALSCVSSVV